MRKRYLTSVKSMNSPRPSWKIVREWDEIISESLNLKLKSETKLSRFVKFNILDSYGLSHIYNSLKPKSSHLSLHFVMTAETSESVFVDKNTIPVIIDFWLEDDQLDDFFETYKNCPLVIVTNREVYELLKDRECPLNVEHWGLSYPDIYKMNIDASMKEYEFCVFGRPNPFFLRMLNQYCEEYQDFEYITNNGDINNREYRTNKGRFIAKDTGRASYMDMIRKTKISCYTTPGLDESKSDTCRFNQVTPRLFEMLSNGCSVIGHYPDSADVQWYNIDNIVPNVDNYEDFKRILNELRIKPIPFDRIKMFMERIYTSTRAKELEAILRKHSILIKQKMC